MVGGRTDPIRDWGDMNELVNIRVAAVTSTPPAVIAETLSLFEGSGFVLVSTYTVEEDGHPILYGVFRKVDTSWHQSSPPSVFDPQHKNLV